MVFGGGSVGLMGLAADAAMEAGGEVIGVITEQLVGAEVAHRGLSRLEVVGSMHERKSRMSELADGFIVLPGGFGTVDEFAEMLTWNQLGLVSKPVVFLDINGFWEPMLAWMDRAVESGFVRPSHRMIAERARDGRRSHRDGHRPGTRDRGTSGSTAMAPRRVGSPVRSPSSVPSSRRSRPRPPSG